MTLNLWVGIFSVICALSALIGGAWGYLMDRRAWNRGVCRDCNTPWEFFDLDSQGGRGYHCASSKHYLWLTWIGEHRAPPHVKDARKAVSK